MRNRTLAMATVVALAIVGTAALAHAQQQPVLLVNIPFEFIIDNQTLPAGEYRVEPSLRAGKEFLTLRSTDGHSWKIFWTMGVYKNDYSDSAKLLFKQYGDQYFLSQVWESGTKLGRQLPLSKREKELRAQATAGEVVLLAHAKK